jgi:copper chaperone CopZ
MRVEKALKEIGAMDVKVNLASKEVRILSSQEMQDDSIIEAISDAGYRVSK